MSAVVTMPCCPREFWLNKTSKLEVEKLEVIRGGKSGSVAQGLQMSHLEKKVVLLFLPSKSEQEMPERGDCEKPCPQWFHSMRSCKSCEDRESDDGSLSNSSLLPTQVRTGRWARSWETIPSSALAIRPMQKHHLGDGLLPQVPGGTARIHGLCLYREENTCRQSGGFLSWWGQELEENRSSS